MIATVYYPQHRRMRCQPAITWVLVMDGRRAQIFTKELDAMAPMLVPVLDAPLSAEPLDHAAPAYPATLPVFQRGGELEPDGDMARLSRQRFIAHVAETLRQMQKEHRFDRLVIVASKTVIGLLRKQMGSIDGTTVAEVAKDLTYAPIGALSLYLAQRQLI